MRLQDDFIKKQQLPWYSKKEIGLWTAWSGLKRKLFSIQRVVLDSVFPLFCIACRVEGEALCFDCIYQAGAPSYYCVVCMQPKERDTLCAQRCSGNALDQLFAFGKHHNLRIQRALHTLKYGYIESVGVQLGQALGVVIQRQENGMVGALFKKHVLVPVPLSAQRFCKRDFNQSELICHGIAKQISGCEIRTDILKRVRHTKEQARLVREQRFANTKNAFSVCEQPPQKVILVDDVATTGATLQACADVLKRAGAQEVCALVVAHG